MRVQAFDTGAYDCEAAGTVRAHGMSYEHPGECGQHSPTDALEVCAMMASEVRGACGGVVGHQGSEDEVTPDNATSGGIMAKPGSVALRDDAEAAEFVATLLAASGGFDTVEHTDDNEVVVQVRNGPAFALVVGSFMGPEEFE
jgi:hypothetical protein